MPNFMIDLDSESGDLPSYIKDFDVEFRYPKRSSENDQTAIRLWRILAKKWAENTWFSSRTQDVFKTLKTVRFETNWRSYKVNPFFAEITDLAVVYKVVSNLLWYN